MSGFLWVAVLGFYCRKYAIIDKLKLWHLVFAVVILLSPFYIFIIKHITGLTVMSSLSVDSILTTALAFVLFRNIKVNTFPITVQRCIELIAKNSFGIYLIHMIFLYPFKIWIAQFNLNYAVQIPITVVLVGVCSLLISDLLSRLPFGKYIVG